MPKKETTDKISTKRTYILLQRSLFQLLTVTPFEKITLTQLCDDAMIPRSTFYRYFEDKHDLLRYCIQVFADTARFNDDVIYFKDDDSLRNFMLVLIQMLDRNKEEYERLYRINKDGELMNILKEFLSDIVRTKLLESEANGYTLKISHSIFIYLLTDFYYSTAKCFLELTDSYSIEAFVDNVCLFSDKDFFA